MKILWTSKEDTAVRMKHGEEKTPVKCGDIFEVDEKRGEELAKYSRDFVIVTGDVKAEDILKARMEAQEELERARLEESQGQTDENDDAQEEANANADGESDDVEVPEVPEVDGAENDGDDAPSDDEDAEQVATPDGDDVAV